MTHCTHRWRISEPDGRATVRGECRICGAEREYLAAGEAMQEWNVTLAGSRPSVKGRGRKLVL